MSLLELDAVDAYYGQSKAIEDVSFSVDQGEVVAVFGRNGAGKTTTLRSIVGVLTPRNGTIQFKDRDVTEMPRFERIRMGIGYVPEDRQVWSNLTVEENLSVPAGRGGERTIADVYELFPTLEELKNARAGTLSGGEQQMLAIGRALTADPELLLLDEPTEGLAPYIVRQIEDIIGDLNDQGITILLVEQNIPVALDVSDYMYILEKGHIVHEGPTDEVKNDDDILDKHLGVDVTE